MKWLKLRRAPADERGVALVITVAAMMAVLLVAAYAIDTAIWFVHARHLQTQADAAALAASQDYACTPGTANTTADSQIVNTVHHYDGTGLSTPAVTNPYNPQVPKNPIPASLYDPTQHNIFSVVNKANYINQSEPNDAAPGAAAWSGSPCKDKAINVKMTETNLPSFFPFVNPSYINREAQVSIEGVASEAGSLPLAVPFQAANVLHATLIDEGNGGAAIPNGRVLLTSTDNINWSAPYGVTLTGSGANAITGPIGLRVDIGGGTTCGGQLVCYDTSSAHNGIAYARVWSPQPNSPGYPTGTTPSEPEVGNATLIQGSSSPCPVTGPPPTPQAFSNFISSSTTCNVRLNTTVYFATGATCGNTPNISLALNATNMSPSMTCNSATTQTTTPCSTAQPCVATTWTSDNVQLGADIPDGPVPFSLSWTQNFGTPPIGAKGGQQNSCATKPCTDSFGTVQRAFDGAYDTTTSNNSASGPIVAATLTDASTGNAFMSHQLDGSSALLNVNVKILDLGAFVDLPPETVTSVGSPVVLHVGTPQDAYAIQCNSNNGSSFFTQYVSTGCPQAFSTTTLYAPPDPCTPAQTPLICAAQDPGGGKKIEPGIDCRINGVLSLNTDGSYNSCSPTSTCVSPNHWVSPNTVSQIESQTPADPRLVHVMLVDSNAWVGVSGSGGASNIPIRDIATFYITGWSASGSGADPCNGTTTPTQPGVLPYTSDDAATTSNVLLGHFVHVILPGSITDPNGQPCSSTFGDCTAVLTK